MLGKEVSRNIALTDDVKPQSLSIMDQIRIMLGKLSNNDVAELEANTKLTEEYLKMVSSLTDFIDKAIAEMRKRNQPSVTISLSEVYRPYIDEVIDEDIGRGRFYKFKVHNRDIPEYKTQKLIITIRRKEI